jgi:hypothetical protein
MNCSAAGPKDWRRFADKRSLPQSTASRSFVAVSANDNEQRK